uniref:C2 domain-containing protein At1g53590-like n=1 Tax=Erigeron canadensis TaxID=72917 RepID=UPI001CB94739|nr:C2 domain-containing protein At1g53590-like [Erigeron canadensis]
MDITEVSIIHHVGIVLLVIWLLSSLNYCHSLVYFFCFIYLYMVHENFSTRFRRKVRFEERRQANQKRVLSDSESVRWLNHLVEKIWPICMENIVSQKILLPIMPWFLQKYKPWTVKEAVVQSLYMGRSPPMVTEMRVCRQSTGDDHVVLELGLNFRTADDMSAILAAKLTKRLGFGMSAKMHLSGMHVEGKVLVGIKFLPKWPFLGRLRVCFVEPPYFQMTVKPIFSRGLDVTEVPGIAGWLDKLLTVAFEETLVEPNMLVVDVEKFVSPDAEPWFSVDAKEPVGYAFVEIIEGSDMKPSDMNGLADPYVKGQLGSYRFRTKTQKKTLSPKWFEEFKIPIASWDSPNFLEIGVRDKDHIYDDTLGDCCVKINDFRDSERHDMWLPLENIKMGRLHLAVKVIEGVDKLFEQPCDDNVSKGELKKENLSVKLPDKSKNLGADSFEPIHVEGQTETGIWVHHPGHDVAQVWEPRKGRDRVHKDTELVNSSTRQVHKDTESINSSIRSEPYPNESSSTDESVEDNKPKSRNAVRRGFNKLGSMFHRSPKSNDDKDKSPSTRKQVDEECDSPSYQNVRAVNEKGIGVKLVMEENIISPGQKSKVGFEESPEGSDIENPDKRKVRDTVKGILKHTGNSARGLMHTISRKGSKGKDKDLAAQSDSCGEAGSIGSPEYKPDGERTPDGQSSPVLTDSSKTAVSPLSPAGEVNVDDPDRLGINTLDLNATEKGEADDLQREAKVDDSEKKVQETLFSPLPQ